MVYRLDADDAVYQRFIRCGSAKPVANYKGAELQRNGPFAGTSLGGQVFGRQWFIASMPTTRYISVSFAVGRQSRWRTTTTKKRPFRRHFIRWPSVWAAMVYRLDADDAVYQRFIRCGSALSQALH